MAGGERKEEQSLRTGIRHEFNAVASEKDLWETYLPAFEALVKEAKSLLMERNNMTEEEAHRYLQKCSMESGVNMVETAQMVLSIMAE